MAGIRGGLGTQSQVAPMRQPKRPGGGGGGGGGGGKRAAGGGLGVGGGGGGGGKTPSGGLYPGESGQAAANQDPEGFIRNMLTQSGVLRGTGTSYDTWADDQLQKNILDKYNAAVGLDQNLSIQDFIKNTYGASYGGKKGQDFIGGDFSSAQGTAADWDKYQSNTETDTWLNNKLAQGGGFVANGGNQDFQAWFGQQFAPQIAQQWEAAKAAQMQAGPTTPGAAGGGGNAQTTLPLGDSGDFGGDPMKRRAWMRDQGINGRLNRMNANRRQDIKQQYADYTGGFETQQTAPGGSTAATATPGTNAPPSMSEYLNGRDITAEARAAYLLRPNTMRTPSSTGLGGRYSWWE